MKKSVSVIGAGFSGLAAAATLASKGYDVTVFEKNEMPGGRARIFQEKGFLFDLGPSWYWMPEIFDEFFQQFGKKSSDYYDLARLDPSYRVYFGKLDYYDIPAKLEEYYDFFEKMEPGSSKSLDKFLKDSEYKYNLGIKKLVRKPGKSILEFLDMEVIKGSVRMDVFRSISKYIDQLFTNPRLKRILEFPVLFLGASAKDTPALYSLMNYADIVLGTWYPMGGMFKVIEGFVSVCEEQGVKFQYNAPVEQISANSHLAKGLVVNGQTYPSDYIIGSADYHHIETKLLGEQHRNYSDKYWQNRKLAPSALLFYIGLDKKLENLEHHNLFFDVDFDIHASEIYDVPKWPGNPALYVSVTSKTDPSVAPEGHENLVILIPVAPGLEDDLKAQECYFRIAMDRLEYLTGQEIEKHIVYKKAYSQSNFMEDYNAFKGNAYGLANTLDQTAIFKPAIENRKLKNLFYTGQLTVPGPGVPPTIISGQLVAKMLDKKAS